MYSLKFVTVSSLVSDCSSLFAIYEEHGFARWGGGENVGLGAGGRNLTVPAARSYYPGLII